jgi:hypothetical protein
MKTIANVADRVLGVFVPKAEAGACCPEYRTCFFDTKCGYTRKCCWDCNCRPSCPPCL